MLLTTGMVPNRNVQKLSLTVAPQKKINILISRLLSILLSNDIISTLSQIPPSHTHIRGNSKEEIYYELCKL